MKERFNTLMLELGGKTIDYPFFSCYAFAQQGIVVCYVELTTFTANNISPNFFVHEHINKQMIYVWEDVWTTQTDLVKSRLFNMLGKCTKIHGRQTTIERVDAAMANDFLNKHHLQGATSAYYKYALMHQNKLVALATFSKARIMYNGPVYYRSYELERFVNHKNLLVVGGLSKLLKHFVTVHHAKHIMTYADCDWSKGNSYFKLGFAQQQMLEPTTFFVDRKTLKRHTAKQLLPAQIASGDFIKITNSGSIKFELIQE